MLRTFARAGFGFILAMLAAGVTQVMFAFPPLEIGLMQADLRSDVLASAGVLALAAATHSAIFSALFALFVIALAEWRGQREWAYYVLTGIVIAAAGFLAQYVAENAAEPTILNNYALVAFATTGAVGGLVYWMFAGRSAGRRRMLAVAGGGGGMSDIPPDSGAARKVASEEKSESRSDADSTVKADGKTDTELDSATTVEVERHTEPDGESETDSATTIEIERSAEPDATAEVESNTEGDSNPEPENSADAQGNQEAEGTPKPASQVVADDEQAAGDAPAPGGAAAEPVVDAPAKAKPPTTSVPLTKPSKREQVAAIAPTTSLLDWLGGRPLPGLATT